MSKIYNHEYSTILPKSFYSRHPLPVARDLLGKLLVRRIDNTIMSGMITETEAYGPPSEDPLVKIEGVRGLRMNWEPGLAWTTYVMRGRPTLNITTIKLASYAMNLFTEIQRAGGRLEHGDYQYWIFGRNRDMIARKKVRS